MASEGEGTDMSSVRVTLADCPIGLFIDSSGQLCVKTEYSEDSGRIRAFVVASGEAFWGPHPQTAANQRNAMVMPLAPDRPMIDLGRALQKEVNHLRGVINTAREHLEVGAESEALRTLTTESSDI